MFFQFSSVAFEDPSVVCISIETWTCNIERTRLGFKKTATLCIWLYCWDIWLFDEISKNGSHYGLSLVLLWNRDCPFESCCMQYCLVILCAYVYVVCVLPTCSFRESWYCSSLGGLFTSVLVYPVQLHWMFDVCPYILERIIVPKVLWTLNVHELTITCLQHHFGDL